MSPEGWVVGKAAHKARELGEGALCRARGGRQSRRAGGGPGGPRKGQTVRREGAQRVKRGWGRRRR